MCKNIKVILISSLSLRLLLLLRSLLLSRLNLIFVRFSFLLKLLWSLCRFFVYWLDVFFSNVTIEKIVWYFTYFFLKLNIIRWWLAILDFITVTLTFNRRSLFLDLFDLDLSFSTHLRLSWFELIWVIRVGVRIRLTVYFVEINFDITVFFKRFYGIFKLLFFFLNKILLRSLWWIT